MRDCDGRRRNVRLSHVVRRQCLRRLPLKPTLDAIGRENLKPGDIIITNDPFATDGLVTHLMDVTLLYPIFRDEKLIAIGWAFVHASDIGAPFPEVFRQPSRKSSRRASGSGR